MAADVAAYSRLMGVDEEGTHERLKAVRRQLIDPKIEEHRGRVVKTTGDGVLAEFASVVDAVRCAAEVQRGMIDREPEATDARQIRFRIGINLGDVIADGGDIFGDGVNVAARLEALAEPGGICISRVVRDQVRDKLDYTFEDLGEQQVKNIARPVRVYRVRDPGAVKSPSPAAQLALPLPDKPSVAVLPFTNMSSGDPEQEFFSDGIAEDIIIALSRYPSLFVIARNSSFTYKGRAVDVKQVGRELGVRYVLEGSLRKAGNRNRVTAQLVEAETGKHVWAERYDRDLADLFAVQDEIAQAVTIAIAPAIADAEQQRAMRKPPESLDAWAAYQRGLWHLSKASAEDNALAEKFFQRAIDLDPIFAGGYTGLAAALNRAGALFHTRNLAEALSAEEALARRAVALDGGDAEARSRLAIALNSRGDRQGAQAEAERALAISPNLADAHGALGVVLTFAGRPKEAVAALKTCVRLDPRSPSLVYRLMQIAQALYFCREYAAAVEAARQAIRSYPDWYASYRVLAAALGQWVRPRKRRRCLRRPSPSRRPRLIGMSASAPLGCGRKTTPTCWKVSARPGCRRNDQAPGSTRFAAPIDEPTWRNSRPISPARRFCRLFSDFVEVSNDDREVASRPKRQS
jgi:adenylate cyclase